MMFGGFPHMPGVKYIQLLTRNLIFRSKIGNSGNQGQINGKTHFFKLVFFNVLVDNKNL